MNRFNNLFFYFLIPQLLFFVTPFFDTAYVHVDINISKALVVHTIAILAFVAGYLIRMYLPGRVDSANSAPAVVGLRAGFFLAAYALLLLGGAIAVWQISLFVNPVDYIASFFNGGFDPNIRAYFLASSGEGGLGGIFKMFTYVPLAIYLLTLALLNLLQVAHDQRRKLVVLSWAALLFTGLKVVFALDRLTIIAIILAHVFVAVKTKRLAGPLVVLAAALFFSEVVSQKRLANAGNLDFLILYYNVGIINLQLMVETLSGYTYGWSTVLSPLIFVLRFVGIANPTPPSNYSWSWGAAEYLVAYAYQDFGIFYFVLFLAFGYLARLVDYKALVQKNIYYVAIYFVLLYNMISFVAVPAFKNVDFWLALIVPLVLVRLFTRRTAAAALLPAPEAASRPIEPGAGRESLALAEG